MGNVFNLNKMSGEEIQLEYEQDSFENHMKKITTFRFYYIFYSYALEQGSSTFSGRGPIYIFHITLRAAFSADYRMIMNILNIIIEI